MEIQRAEKNNSPEQERSNLDKQIWVEQGRGKTELNVLVSLEPEQDVDAIELPAIKVEERLKLSRTLAGKLSLTDMKQLEALDKDPRVKSVDLEPDFGI